MSSLSAPDVAVVGGGVIGCATAYFLGRLHGAKCLILERDDVASHASGNAAGELSPLSQRQLSDEMTSFCTEGVRLHQQWAPALSEESGLDYALTPMPVLRPTFDAMEEQEARALLRWCEDLRMEAEWVEKAALRKMGSWLSSSIRGALYLQEFQLETPVFATALARAAVHHGATIQTGEEVTAVTASPSETTVSTKQGSYRAAKALIATGPWSGLASDALGLPLPVMPLRGQIIYLRPDRKLPRQAIFHSSGYVLAKPSGALMVGTTEEDAGFVVETTDQARQEILRAARRLAPITRGMAVERMTACLRPLSVDGLPIIGNLKSRPNLYVATGHGRKGILLSIATGKHLADLIATGRSDYALDAFSPARFLRS